MAQIFHPSTNTISKFSIFCFVFIAAGFSHGREPEGQFPDGPGRGPHRRSMDFSISSAM